MMYAYSFSEPLSVAEDKANDLTNIDFFKD